MEVQTRSYDSTLSYFSTIREAYDAWKKDKNIWKISWNTDVENDTTDRHRFIIKIRSDIWDIVTEQILDKMCPQYELSGSKSVFFIEEPLISPNMIDKHQFNIMNKTPSIRQVLTEEEFIQKYCL